MTSFSGRFGASGAAPTERDRAVVGVMCCNRTLDGRAAQAVASRFVGPLARYADLSVMLIPAIDDAVDARRFAGLLDALLLTGSCSNIDPMLYGGAVLPSGQGTDHDRDAVALRLAAHMIEAGKPVFGICRGLQELNVLFGGSLSPHAGAAGHHRPAPCSADAVFDHHHEVVMVGKGPLARTLGAGRHRVNSVHEQGIDRIGAGLHVEAIATDDGLVEAFWAEPFGAPVIAVQWHPEWDVARNAESRVYFNLLGEAATAARQAA